VISLIEVVTLHVLDLENRLLIAKPVTGKCYVITYSKSHNLTFADLGLEQILPIIETWSNIYTAHLSPTSPLAKVATPTMLMPHGGGKSRAYGETPYRHMQIFENKGSAMGCSNPHPHGQIWATTGLPEEASLELQRLMQYRRQQGGAHLLEDYANLEIAKEERVIYKNDTFLAVCPWWAVWPYEVLVLSRTNRRAISELSDNEKRDLATVLSDVTRRYDNLFETHFPYSSYFARGILRVCG
jgi:UDPglucose--hexose-1-phosphate uridylyltransferase